MSTRPEPEGGAAEIDIRRRPRLRVVLDLCSILMHVFVAANSEHCDRQKSTKTLLKYNNNNEAKPRERSDRVYFLPLGKKSSS